jgi:DNA-binding LacI/PurR family transcriptional regulator
MSSTRENDVTDIKILEESLYSLHVQLYQNLRRLIYTGHWPTHSLVPSEQLIAKHLTISRSTVRLAFQRAELEGLIRRVPGKGTFVAYSHQNGTHSGSIAYITPYQPVSEWGAVILNGAESAARARGFRLLYCRRNEDQREAQLLHELQDDHSAGILLWPEARTSLTQDEIASYRQLHIPVVFMDRTIEGADFDCVTSDNYAGATLLMRHLVELGHRRIVFLTHRYTALLTVAERYRAYEDVMRQANLYPAKPWFIGDGFREIDERQILDPGGDAAAVEIMQILRYLQETRPRPTAVFALNDIVAILVMRAAALLGIQVPHELSIAGFDDMPFTACLNVPLTTVSQDTMAIGGQAAQLLINRIEGWESPATIELIPTQLKVRLSTATVPETAGNSERG